MSFIELANVVKTYTEGAVSRRVLDALNLEIGRGEFVVLMGRSGAGKSTLLNLIGGLDAPSSGRIRIGDFNIDEMDEEERTLFRRRHLGFVFQAWNLIPTLSVLENVLLPLELAAGRSGSPDDRAARRNRALGLLEEVGLGDRGDSYPDVLSGGEQQRVAVVRALIHDPLLLLADEPTGNLDYETGRQVMDLLHDLVRRTNTTMIVVTHDRDFLRASDRILGLRSGRLRTVSPEELPGVGT
ncbi:MAG: ABC transporter ATP-binding protein [Rhodothermales bacterium]|nr:ABC transporter ATP-binding protein [Rhodothermales bacterium]